MSDGQPLPDEANIGSELRSSKTGGESWYEEKLWRRWQAVKNSPDFIDLCDKLKFDQDGFPVDFEGLLGDPEVLEIMQRHGISWIPHYDDDRLTKSDMIELFGTCIDILCPPSTKSAINADFVWNGDFSIRSTNQDTQDEVLEEHVFSNRLLLGIDISHGIPEAQIAAEVIELVRDIRESIGIDPENRGRESAGRTGKLSVQLISQMRAERAQGKSLKDITIEHWDRLASEGDKEFTLKEWGADIKSTTAYKTLQRYMR